MILTFLKIRSPPLFITSIHVHTLSKTRYNLNPISTKHIKQHKEGKIRILKIQYGFQCDAKKSLCIRKRKRAIYEKHTSEITIMNSLDL